MDLKEFIKLSRKIGIPRGDHTDDFTKSSSRFGSKTYETIPQLLITWRKAGAFAGGKTIGRVIIAAKAAGFREEKRTIEEGYSDNVRSNRKFVLGDVVLTTSEFYGSTRDYNRYDIRFECKS